MNCYPSERTHNLPEVDRWGGWTLTKRAGYTQVELAEELGTSQRMIAYYESRSLAPTALLPAISQALHITVDELLGTTPLKKKEPKPRNTRLQRHLCAGERGGDPYPDHLGARGRQSGDRDYEQAPR